MSLDKEFAKTDAYNYALVEAQTFGHLVPGVGHHDIDITFCHSVYRDTVIISQETELPCSPWLYQDLCNFVECWAKEKDLIYKFSGKYNVYKNGKRDFRGTIQKGKFNKNFEFSIIETIDSVTTSN